MCTCVYIYIYIYIYIYYEKASIKMLLPVGDPVALARTVLVGLLDALSDHLGPSNGASGAVACNKK
jgi:hypothetical protein